MSTHSVARDEQSPWVHLYLVTTISTVYIPIIFFLILRKKYYLISEKSLRHLYTRFFCITNMHIHIFSIPFYPCEIKPISTKEIHLRYQLGVTEVSRAKRPLSSAEALALPAMGQQCERWCTAFLRNVRAWNIFYYRAARKMIAVSNLCFHCVCIWPRKNLHTGAPVAGVAREAQRGVRPWIIGAEGDQKRARARALPNAHYRATFTAGEYRSWLMPRE